MEKGRGKDRKYALLNDLDYVSSDTMIEESIIYLLMILKEKYIYHFKMNFSLYLKF